MKQRKIWGEGEEKTHQKNTNTGNLWYMYKVDSRCYKYQKQHKYRIDQC